MAKHYGWAHDYWRRMGVRELDAWVEVTTRQTRRQSSPDRWDSDDPWFDDQHRSR